LALLRNAEREEKEGKKMSFIPVLQYGVGLGIFGFIYWLLDGIMDDFVAVGIHETGSIYTFLTFVWAAVVVIYLIFGGWWVIKQVEN